MSTATYAVLPMPPHPFYTHPCPTCDGRGITGDRYQMPTDNGPTLLVDVLCPDCTGCGNGDPEHADCPAGAHAYPEEYAPEDDDDLAELGDSAERCPSCGSGRGWNAVQGIGTTDDGDAEGLALLRVPCGCSTERLVIGTDPAAL